MNNTMKSKKTNRQKDNKLPSPQSTIQYAEDTLRWRNRMKQPAEYHLLHPLTQQDETVSLFEASIQHKAEAEKLGPRTNKINPYSTTHDSMTHQNGPNKPTDDSIPYKSYGLISDHPGQHSSPRVWYWYEALFKTRSLCFIQVESAQNVKKSGELA